MLIERNNPVSMNDRLGSRRGQVHPRRWLAAGAAVLTLAGLGSYAFGTATGGAPAFVLDLEEVGKRPTPPLFQADCSAQPAALQAELSRIAASFEGQVGIAVTKAGCDWTVGARLDQHFPQQSVSKLWVAMSVLDAVDNGRMRLDQQITITPRDLTLFNQPLQWEVLDKGVIARPVQMLMANALSLSDNTANDRLLWTVGGPNHVRAFLKSREIAGIRFGPGERLLQSAAAGLTWSPELAAGRNFEQARARLPKEVREAALAKYVADPMDGATPAGMAQALARLAKGELLSEQSTKLLLDTMGKSRSGPMRLKAGLPPGWKAFHKTGTGQELGSLATGYNDVAVVEAPDGSYYGVAVLIGQTHQPIRARMEMMQSVSAALARWHELRTS
ncbi:class A beta-lactamase [Novosphingobium ginsenosidimutans]|uniref:beta-lactamase n=2 Tax=Novosphingobium ginsenosidimutans TaxID=1176536 RepID=A0A5B8S5E3_9SPHN|nr:serine hydrolase [Novosphingobium ginsenosidimutans]